MHKFKDKALQELEERDLNLMAFTLFELWDSNSMKKPTAVDLRRTVRAFYKGEDRSYDKNRTLWVSETAKKVKTLKNRLLRIRFNDLLVN